jgi:hypothetical protein
MEIHNGKIEIISLVVYICSDLIHYVIQAFVHIVSEIMVVVLTPNDQFVQLYHGENKLYLMKC